MSGADQVWKAIADPTRRAILDVLANGPRTTGDLCEQFDHLGRTSVMKHLDVLQKANLVVVRREGRTRWNFINPVPVQQVCDAWVGRHVKSLVTSLQRLKALAEHEVVAPDERSAPVDGTPGESLVFDAIEGDGVVLRPTRAADSGELFACGRDDRIWDYMAYGPFRDEAAMRAWLAACGRSKDPIHYTVRNASGQALGMVSYLEIVPEHRRVEVGHIWYGPQAQRTTVNTETLYLLLRTAFEAGYRRVEWKCNALNQRSCQAALRLGFSFEGIFRQHLIVKGRNRDTAWFSMTDADWRTARPAFETWLSWRDGQRPSLASLRTA